LRTFFRFEVQSHEGSSSDKGVWDDQGHWDLFREQIGEGTYYPQLVRRVEITQIPTTIYDPTYSAHSYGFHPNRQGHDAVREARSYMKDG